MPLAIIGDFNPTFRPHMATNEALEHSMQLLETPVAYEWIATDRIEDEFDEIIKKFSGFWIAPGSPYHNMKGALSIIKYARIHQIPTLGICGGFQHMVIEYARNVLKIKDAQHAEYDPYASELVINPLSCSLVGQTLAIQLVDQASQTFSIFGTNTITELYYCNFGLNPHYQEALHTAGFKVVGIDSSQEARILELENHPFFIATLFVPQNNSTQENPHPLITHFVKLLAEQSKQAC